MPEYIEGSCLCEAVSYFLELPYESFVHCYCSRCRKATGTARASNILSLAERLNWETGEELILRYDLPEAQSFATAVCRICLAPVPHLTRSGLRVIVPAGSVDTPLEEGPVRHVEWESRCAWASDDETDLPRDP